MWQNELLNKEKSNNIGPARWMQSSRWFLGCFQHSSKWSLRRITWECLAHTFSIIWESKVTILKKSGEQDIFFPHLFSSLNVFNFCYLEKPNFKINLNFYHNSIVTEKGMIFLPQRLRGLELEHCFSCDGGIFFWWVFVRAFLSDLC